MNVSQFFNSLKKLDLEDLRKAFGVILNCIEKSDAGDKVILEVTTLKCGDKYRLEIFAEEDDGQRN